MCMCAMCMCVNVLYTVDVCSVTAKNASTSGKGLYVSCRKKSKDAQCVVTPHQIIHPIISPNHLKSKRPARSIIPTLTGAAGFDSRALLASLPLCLVLCMK